MWDHIPFLIHLLIRQLKRRVKKCELKEYTESKNCIQVTVLIQESNDKLQVLVDDFGRICRVWNDPSNDPKSKTMIIAWKVILVSSK